MRLTGFENALFSWKLATLRLWQPRITHSRPPLIPPFFSNRWNRYKYSPPPPPHASVCVFLSLSFFSLPFSLVRFFPQRVFAIVFFLSFFFLSPPFWPGCLACTREDNRKNAGRINISRICIAFYRLNPVARKL